MSLDLDHEKLISDLLDESDLCRNEGADDIAALLDEAVKHIRTLIFRIRLIEMNK